MDQKGERHPGRGLGRFAEDILRRRSDPECRRQQNELLAQHYDCIKCCDEGSIVVQGDDGRYSRVSCKGCAEKRQRERVDRQRLHRVRYAELPKRFQRATFDTFEQADDDVLQQAWIAAKNYAVGVRTRPWLSLMSREPGTGKSHLAAAIVNYRVDHPGLPSAKWIGVAWWLERLRRGQFNGTYDETFDIALSAPCLILDDFGAEYHRTRPGDSESWAAERLYVVINQRYEAELPTVITSNVAMERLPPRIASRITDVGTKLVTTVMMETRSYRAGG